MKASSKLLLTALLFFIATVVAYNAVLTKEYKKGTYKDPYQNYSSLDHTGFTAIDVRGANYMRVKIIPGEYKVWVHKSAKDFIKVKQEQDRLLVGMAFDEEVRNVSAPYYVIISTPDLKHLQTDASYTVNGKELYMDTVGDGKFNGVTVYVQDLSMDSLNLVQSRASKVMLSNNKLGALKATVGEQDGSQSILELSGSNQVQQANLDIKNRSELHLENVRIPKLTYTFSDNTKVTVSGASLASVLKN
ncbi:hypothetical protein [Pontibacter rugosus]|uniref:Auto-transporter adhesin head GIN domain-containing protein n=1 Tax=Pontibacter rugosus TaxID=1745966 RepID=A0ABW3SJK2_9BACT